MTLKNISPIETPAWKNLKNHFAEIKNNKIIDFFKDTKRLSHFSVSWKNFYVDFSKNRLNLKTLNLLLDLAKQCDLQNSIQAQFLGKKINKTENRSVLHTACRCIDSDKILVDGIDIVPEIINERNKIKSFCDKVLDGHITGSTGKKITDVVNIGIGGSDLGPRMVTEALKFYRSRLNTHFISNVDGDHVYEVLKALNPETTLFIVVSKTFTTQETLTNAKTIKNWMISNLGNKSVEHHFVAVSSNKNEIANFGIKDEYTFSMNDWVGGRFSIWSSVGLIISLSIGFENYNKFLNGARLADDHFRSSSFEKNIPVLMGLISVWYNNFFECESEAVISYSQYLNKLPAYLQQSLMESNGKNVDRNGKNVKYQTGNIVWGDTGTNSQHAFFQLIHQGTKLIPCDFIGFKHPLHKENHQHDILMSNFFAQTEALLMGKSLAKVEDELKRKSQSKEFAPYKVFKGNIPSNSFLIDKLSPESLGSLIAFYEHKIFVQGIIWNVFSYDQWGVELGKELASSVLREIETKTLENHDPSTSSLVHLYNSKD